MDIDQGQLALEVRLGERMEVVTGLVASTSFSHSHESSLCHTSKSET